MDSGKLVPTGYGRAISGNRIEALWDDGGGRWRRQTIRLVVGSPC
jgi:hypothetical protein